MSVTRYRGVEQMPRQARVTGPQLGEKIAAVWARAFSLVPPLNTPGVARFRSIEEAQRARDAAVRDRARTLRCQRDAAKGM